MCELLESNITGLISYVSCETLSVLDSQVHEFHIPHISITHTACSMDEHPPYSLHMRVKPSNMIDVLLDVMVYVNWKTAYILYDSSIGEKVHMLNYTCPLV